MAAKKTTALTAEERLEKALVPADEQPYEVPENWCWANLISLCDHMHAGGDKPESFSEVRTELFNVPVVANGIANDGIIGYTDVGIEKAGTVTVSGRGTIGYSIYRNYSYYPIVRLIVLSPNKCIHPLYLKYSFDRFVEEGTGSSIPQLTIPSLKQKKIPLPPLTEQRRIVDRIEELFFDLDKASEKAQAILDSADSRNNAILNQAFNGELTEQWRNENGVTLDSWENQSLSNFISLLSGQDFPPQKYISEPLGIPYITGASNFNSDGVIINRWTTCGTVISQKNDVLLVCKGSGYGKTIIADYEEAHIARQIMALRVKENLNNRFLLYCLQNKLDYLRNSGRGLIPGISRNVVLDMPITLPTIEEQAEIVRILDELLDDEQRIKKAAEETLAKIDLMKKSILADAFRGKLGTNDPSDEPATELLKQILA